MVRIFEMWRYATGVWRAAALQVNTDISDNIPVLPASVGKGTAAHIFRAEETAVPPSSGLKELLPPCLGLKKLLPPYLGLKKLLPPIFRAEEIATAHLHG
jgi:hypothetical protein